MENKFLNKLSTFLFYFSILVFITAFNFSDNRSGGWYQQFMPNLGGRSVSDITFLDSLTGWAVTPFTQQNDTVYVVKTTNGGDNWFINYIGTGQFVGMNRIIFLNMQIGFACGNGLNNSSQNNFAKTINGGINWFNINPPDPFEVYHDMSVLNEDTIWIVSSNSPTGGVFHTTNGGVSWIQQFSAGTNPNKIYMYNSSIGFISISSASSVTLKTTNGGFNWFNVLNEGFTDMHFIDSLIGWKCWGELDSIKKTTNGGITWQKQLLPPTGGFYALSVINDLAVLNADTIWGVGAVSNLIRGLIYISYNGGTTWNYQLPDTSIHIPRYYHTQFVNKLNGWAYFVNGVHTTTGGIITPISQISIEIPTDFKLHQNYPNPFNPTTSIVFEVKRQGVIKLMVYDIAGKEISILVNEKLNAGEYKYDFNSGSLSSGVYFYSLTVDGKKVDTKKMMLVR